MRYYFFLPLFALFSCCANAQSDNPHMAGFDSIGSDKAAIAIADKVMAAQGGRTLYDNTRYLRWTFFGRRVLTWDKWQGNVRIDWKDNSRNIIVNIHNGQGKVRLKGVEQNDPDTLKKYLDIGKKVWINDSYWLVMPFKLKDSGVTLKYLSDTAHTADNKAAYLLQMTFKGVGVTPDNKYHVWVDQGTHLVSQWAFFDKFTDEKPQFVNPWTDYKSFNGLMLSSGRGRGAMSDIEVPASLAESIFEKF